MPSPSIVTIGNAIVDIIAQSDDAFIHQEGMDKNAMNLIDGARATSLYEMIGPAMEISGGSAANTAAGIASLGGNSGFIGKIADDTMGQIFHHDIKKAGVEFTPAYADENQTACSIILVTPDTQRTMNTFLGASVALTPDDMDEDMIAAADWVYLEGYLFDAPLGPACYQRVADIAHFHQTKVSVSLSDAWCVQRHYDDLTAFLANHTDLIFGNEDELMSLFPDEDNIADALHRLPELTPEAVITLGKNGSIIIAGDATIAVDARHPAKVLDTTGAGDLYAAGYLFGRQMQLDFNQSARIATLAATEIITHIGARPQVSLAKKISLPNN